MPSATTPQSEDPTADRHWVAGATHSAADCPGTIVTSRRVEHIDDETTMIAMDMLVCVPVEPNGDTQHNRTE